jgi:alanine racemase
MLSWIELDGSAFLKNVESFRTILPTDTRVMVVVKANAYGHGLPEITPLAAKAADWLGVNTIAEARLIAATGVGKPIAILGYSEIGTAEAIVSDDFRQVVYRHDVAEALSRAAKKLARTAHIHLKIETGTNRQGVPLDELESFVRSIRDLPGLEIEGLYTHFANIEDTLDPSFAQLQLERFHQALAVLENLKVRPAIIHAAATSGALLYPETSFAMIRLGIGTYGIWPSRETQLAARERGRLIKLTPVLTWKTQIAQIKKVPNGDYVGYGLTYQASRPMRVAVLPIGYYDGYDRKLSNSARVLVRGQFAPVIGRIAMNMTMIDVTDIEAQNDDEVVLIGHQGKHEIRVEELAEKCGTIAYEFLSRINPLLPRVVTQPLP